MEHHSTLTIGQIEDALETELFPNEGKSDFEIFCKEREKLLKQYLNICGQMLVQHVQTPGLALKDISYWKKEKIKVCMSNLFDYLEELYNELDKEKIEDYCNGISSYFLAFKRPFDPDITLLTLNSYYGAIVSDIYWIPSISIMDAMKLSGGQLPLSELGKEIPRKIMELKKLLKSNSKYLNSYRIYFDTINEAMKCFAKSYNKAFNLLLLTSIEGLTRQLGNYLIEKQNLYIDPYSETYNSLDGFLRKIPWKEELPISKTTLYLLTSHYKRINYNDPYAEPPKAFEQVNVGLKTRLDFLRRRFKENRDIILHSQEIEYDKPQNGFINISALLEVFSAIREFHNLYDEK
jgi:hypothetical protein